MTNEDSGMTARERTDRLCNYFGFDKGCEQAMEIEEAIKSAEAAARREATHEFWKDKDITRAYEKGRKEGYEEGSNTQFLGDKEHFEQRIHQARKEAFEEAAKIAEKYDFDGDTGESLGLAEAIRKRAGAA